jgi:ligand-binding sensor domain-containing protein/signal transduction histidine kinase
VQAIAQTKDGYLWFGTQEGLVRFDGVRFEIFNSSTIDVLRGNNVNSVVCDHEGTLWIGTNYGAVTYRDGRFASIAGTEETRVLAFAEDSQKNGMWVGTTTGLFQYRDGHIVEEKDSPKPVYALSMPRATLWIGAADGLYRRGSGITQKIPDSDNTPVYAVHSTPTGEVWFGGPGGLQRLHGSRVDRPIADLKNEETGALTSDRHGNLWVGTRRGLWRWNDGGLSRVGSHDGLAQDFVETIFEDSEGTLWVGMHLRGVSQLYGGLFLSYTRAEGLLHDVVWTVAEARDGTIWAGTENGGVNRFRDGMWQQVAVAGELQPGVVAAVAPETEQRAWVGTYGKGLYFVDGKSVRSYTEANGLPNDFIVALHRARDGSLWVGTTAGLARFMSGRFTAYGMSEGLPAGVALTIYEDRLGRLWTSTGKSRGPRLFDGRRFTSLFNGRKLPDATVMAILQDRGGDMWFGTRQGVYRTHSGGVFRYGTEHGMPAGVVSHLFEDDLGFLWLATPTGMLRVSRQELEDVLQGRAKRVISALFGVSDGMPTAECSYGAYPSAWHASDGRIWLATPRGLTVLDPRAAAPVLRVPPLIERVRVNTALVAHDRPVLMKSDRDRIEFRYTAPTALLSKRVRFRYRLEGYDRQWLDGGESRVVEYSNLPPGDFKFVVEANDTSGRQWLSSRRSVTVQRRPTVFETYWFLFLCVGGLLSLAWFAHQRRIGRVRLRLEAIHNERKRISLEMHDTLAQGLTGAMLHIQSALDGGDDPQERVRSLETGKTLLMDTLAESRRVLQNVRSERLETDDLAKALTGVLATLTNGLPIKAVVEVHGKPRRLADPLVEHHLLRIGQEAITNALRHANATNVVLSIDFQSERVLLKVSDDGRGSGSFSLERPGPSTHGLRGMRERADQIRAKLTARNVGGRGFEVVVEVNA